jgi:hypothetical protein
LHLRTGDPVYRQLARRWSKVLTAQIGEHREHAA